MSKTTTVTSKGASSTAAASDMKAPKGPFVLVFSIYARQLPQGHVDPAVIAFMLNERGVCEQEADFLFWGHTTVPGIRHLGDDAVFSFGGEELRIDTSKIPVHVQKVAFVLTTTSNLCPGLKTDSLRAIGFGVGVKGEYKDKACFEAADMGAVAAVQLVTLERVEGNTWTLSWGITKLDGDLPQVCSQFGIETS